MKKYFNPEYANIVTESNDVIATSIDITEVTPENVNYTQFNNTTYNENKEAVSVTTTVYGDVGVLLGQ